MQQNTGGHGLLRHILPTPLIMYLQVICLKYLFFIFRLWEGRKEGKKGGREEGRKEEEWWGQREGGIVRGRG
jgi:hypothetical protein